MTDWLTRALQAVSDVIQVCLDQLEANQVRRASKRYADAPVANRWYNAWREQKAMSLGMDDRLDDAPSNQPLTDQELSLLLNNFYGIDKSPEKKRSNQVIVSTSPSSNTSNSAKSRSAIFSHPSPAIAAKQRLMAQKDAMDREAATAAKPSQAVDSSPLSRVAQAVRQPTPERLNTLPVDQPLRDGVSHTAFSVIAESTQQRAVKPFSTPVADEQLLAPNPLAHLMAKNQFLSDRINRLAEQYFRDNDALTE